VCRYGRGARLRARCSVRACAAPCRGDRGSRRVAGRGAGPARSRHKPRHAVSAAAPAGRRRAAGESWPTGRRPRPALLHHHTCRAHGSAQSASRRRGIGRRGASTGQASDGHARSASRRTFERSGTRGRRSNFLHPAPLAQLRRMALRPRTSCCSRDGGGADRLRLPTHWPSVQWRLSLRAAVVAWPAGGARCIGHAP
jgi:hypothetical protein